MRDSKGGICSTAVLNCNSRIYWTWGLGEDILAALLPVVSFRFCCCWSLIVDLSRSRWFIVNFFRDLLFTGDCIVTCLCTFWIICEVDGACESNYFYDLLFEFYCWLFDLLCWSRLARPADMVPILLNWDRRCGFDAVLLCRVSTCDTIELTPLVPPEASAVRKFGLTEFILLWLLLNLCITASSCCKFGENLDFFGRWSLISGFDKFDCVYVCDG